MPKTQKRTSPPMTLAAMRTFAMAQVAHYTELLGVLTKIQEDPLSVLPQERRHRGPDKAPRRRTARRRRAAAAPAGPPSAASAYALAAVRKLRLATNAEIVAHAKRAGWGTVSATPAVVMSQALLKLVKVGTLRRTANGPGKVPRYALKAPSKAAAAKLAAAQAMVNGTGAAPAGAEVVN